MAGGDARLQAEPFDGVERDEAEHVRGQLGVAGLCELLRLGLEQQVGEVAIRGLGCLLDELP